MSGLTSGQTNQILPPMTEVADKTARVAAVARERGLGGVLLATPPGFAWITAGGTNRIDLTREPGAGAVLVTADERRLLIANSIEMPRLRAELPDGPFDSVELPWATERADPRIVAATASRLCENQAIGADARLPGTTFIEPDLARARAPLTTEELRRFRALGRDAGIAVGDAMRTVQAGWRERDIAAHVATAVYAIGARPIVLLVGADDRLAHFRHPVPTNLVWRQTAMAAVCAERAGLVVALSRIVNAGAISDLLRERTQKTASVFAALLTATRAGTSGAELFHAARWAYAAAGFPDEEQRHHQGGATGYRSREWVAHPASKDIVTLPQAFAWNPSITGTKIEDTALVTAEGAELITTTPGWPVIDEGGYACADILSL